MAPWRRHRRDPLTPIALAAIDAGESGEGPAGRVRTIEAVTPDAGAGLFTDDVGSDDHWSREVGNQPLARVEVITFEDQAVVVTGAGRGLGRLYALDMARRGALVVVNDLGGTTSGSGADAAVADEVVEEILEAGGTAVASYDSVDSPEGGEAIIQTALDAFGRVDAVVSNAGIYEAAPIDKISPDRWRAMLSVHLDGAFHITQPALRVMKAQQYGRFVFISSQMGAFGSKYYAAYGAAKAGIVGLANVVALEGERHGILANTVLPIGFSRMLTESIASRTVSEIEEKFFASIDPERVVPLVVYFASSACDVTHHSVSAASGRYARVFTALSEGWLADPDASPATAEDIAARYAEISATDDFSIPLSAFDEILGVCDRLGIS